MVALLLAALPTLLAGVLTRQLSAALRVPVSVGWIALNPIGPTLALHDVAIGAGADGAPFATVAAVRLDLALEETLRGRPALDTLDLVEPWLDLRRTAAGDFNVSALWAAREPEEEAADAAPEPPAPRSPVRIGALRLRRGSIEFRDETSDPPLETSLHVDEAVADDLALALGGAGTIAVKVQSRVNDDPVTLVIAYRAAEGDSDLRATLETTNASLAGVLVHVPLGWGQVTGTADATVAYRRTVEKGRLAAHRLDVIATARDLSVADVDAPAPGLRAEEARLPELTVDFIRQRVGLGRIELDGFEAVIARTETGLAIPLVSTAGGDEGSAWRTDLQAVVLGTGTLTLRDLPPGAPDLVATVGSGRITSEGDAVRFTLATEVAGGTLGVDGTAADDTRVTLRFADVDAPVLARQVGLPVALAQGELAGTLVLAFGAGPTELSGRLTASDVKNAPSAEHPEEVFAWATLEVELAPSTVAPPHLRATHVRVEWPYVMIHRRSDGVYPFTGLGATVTPSPAAGGDTAPPLLVAERVEIMGGRLEFYDTVLPKAYGTDLLNVTGTLHDLRVDSFAVVRFELEGSIDELSPVRARGSIAPERIDATITADRVFLAPLTPYLEPALRYEITAGLADLAMDVTRRADVLRAANDVDISRLAMRGSGPDPFVDDLGMPLTVALALMKDRRGEIHLELPVEIDLETQEYRLRVHLLDALRQAFLGALQTPLRLLGRVFGRRETERFDLKPVPFAAGSAELGADGLARVAQIARLLERHASLRAFLLPTVSTADAAGEDVAAERDALAALARTRADAVLAALTRTEGIARARVEVGDVVLDDPVLEASPGVDVQLRAR